MSDLQREIAWKRNGKGNGLRWLILRDLTAGLAMQPLTTEQVEDFLMALRGISWNTTRQMMRELTRAGFLEETPPGDGMEQAWRATPKGVTVFCGRRQSIPARIVQAALITQPVSTDDAVQAINLKK